MRWPSPGCQGFVSPVDPRARAGQEAPDALIAGIGLLILVPAALYLSTASAGDVGTGFHVVQSVELLAGAINLTLVGSTSGTDCASPDAAGPDRTWSASHDGDGSQSPSSLFSSFLFSSAFSSSGFSSSFDLGGGVRVNLVLPGSPPRVPIWMV